MFTDFVLPFEATSVLILMAIVGAMYLARRETVHRIWTGSSRRWSTEAVAGRGGRLRLLLTTEADSLIRLPCRLISEEVRPGSLTQSTRDARSGQSVRKTTLS
jgi:hypothetical protein